MEDKLGSDPDIPTIVAGSVRTIGELGQYIIYGSTYDQQDSVKGL